MTASIDHMRVLLAYPKHFGTTGWYLERALMRLSSIYTLSIDLRTYKTGIVRFFKNRFGKSIDHFEQGETSFAKRIPGLVAKSLIQMGFTSEPRYSVDLKSMISRIGDIDLLIHVDGIGSPIIKNVDKASRSVLWALDTHIKPKYLLRIAPLYDYVFVAQKRDLSKFRQVNPKSFWLPYAADPTTHKPHSNVDITRDIVFIGSLIPGRHDERMRLVKKLQKKFHLDVLQSVWLDEMAKAYSSSKLAFNRSIDGDLNMRVFEALSCGRLLLADLADGILDLFENKKHLIIYDESNLEDLARYYLDNVEERNEIANNGMHEVWQNHTYDIRLTEMLRKIG